MWSRVHIAALTALLAASYLPDRVEAEPGPPTPQSSVLIQDVRIFDSKNGSLLGPSNVLVRGNKIDKISTGPISIDDVANVTTIDGRGRTLMPGLIDVHWHAMLVRPNPVEALASDIGYLNLLAGAEATATLMRGFTTIRDMGGPVFGLKRAIDEGLLPGPRIYPSGAVITITGGHGDFRSLSELPRRPGTLSRESRWAQPSLPTARMKFGCARESNSCKAHLRSNSLLAAVLPRRSVLSMSSPLRSPSFAQPSKRLRIGAPMSPPMLTRRSPSSVQSPRE